MNPYTYLFVREDLSPSQQIVQAAHAVDEIGRRFKSDGTNFMVLCGADHEEALINISEWLCINDIAHEMFWEPDINSYTAIATRPLIGNERKPCKRFRLK